MMTRSKVQGLSLEKFKPLQDEVLKLRKENASKDETIAKLLECVEFYADKDNWGEGSYGISYSNVDVLSGDTEQFGCDHIGGKKARATLKEIKGEK